MNKPISINLLGDPKLTKITYVFGTTIIRVLKQKNQSKKTKGETSIMATTLKPLGDRVIIKPETAEVTTQSGIVLPDTAQEKPQSGKVLSVGAGRTTDEGKLIPLTVKEGDIVIYAKYGGTEIKLEGQEYLIVKESDILAIKS
jgi:chaperonin GroES